MYFLEGDSQVIVPLTVDKNFVKSYLSENEAAMGQKENTSTGICLKLHLYQQTGFISKGSRKCF